MTCLDCRHHDTFEVRAGDAHEEDSCACQCPALEGNDFWHIRCCVALADSVGDAGYCPGFEAQP